MNKNINVKVCIIGAGPSGIAAAKNCCASGIEFTVFEKNNKVGGNWVFNSKTGHSSVYNNTHIISSKTLSEYEDFPMPENYPDYPSHRQLQAYFESYAKHFDIYESIRFEHQILNVKKQSENDWLVTFLDNKGKEQVEHYTHIMVANGHHWDPKWPSYSGEFSGKYFHSHDFKGTDDSWRDKRVLVIGAGNSACDVAVESSRIASKVCLSMRSPQWFIPKFMFGVPTDVLGSYSNWMPAKLKQLTMTWLLRLYQGRYRKYGLPEPKTLVLNQHPTANSDLLEYIRHGRIQPRGPIKDFDQNSVEFESGNKEDFDIVVACTGFNISFPFFEKSFIHFSESKRVPLYKKMMHAEHKDLYFIGLFQPLGCIWPLADYQAKLACKEILGVYQRPSNMLDAIDKELKNPHYNWTDEPRHSTEVDYHRFRRELIDELA